LTQGRGELFQSKSFSDILVSGNVRRLTPFLILFFFSSTASAQNITTQFNFTISHLPGTHSWDYWTDPNETGHVTNHSFGIDSFVFNNEVMTSYFDRVYRFNDTLSFSNGTCSLIITTDSTNIYQFKNIAFYEYPYYINHCDPVIYTFSLDSVAVVETSKALICTIVGNSILDHRLVLKKEKCDWTASSDQSWKDIYTYNGIVDSASKIYFAIGKDQILDVLEGNKQDMLLVYPQPASKEIYVQAPASVLLSEITIYDFLGRRVIESPLQHVNDIHIDVSSLNPGIYYLSSGALHEKIIINR
jgi:hypothetical protein